MNTAFDNIATHYDVEFTHSAIGVAQRQIVWNYLSKIIGQNSTSLSVLELNCGTGEDAIWLAQKGAEVLATDISTEMLAVANTKVLVNNLSQKIQLQQLDIRQTSEKLKGQKFDIIFSNFGGLNCVSKQEMQDLLQNQLPNLLKSKGRFVFVIMPNFCLWESLVFIKQFSIRKAFRRLTTLPLPAKLDENTVVFTYYHSPKWIAKNIAPSMKVNTVLPVGFFIPPSYLNQTFGNKRNLLHRLQNLENRIIDWSIFANASDHYLIDIQLQHQ